MEPKDFGRALLRRKGTVITAVIVVMTFALMGSLRKVPQYVAQCEVQFGAVLSDPTDPESRPIETIGGIYDQEHFFTSPAVAAAAAKLLPGVPAEVIQPKVNAKLIQNTQAFRIQIVDTPAASGQSYDPAVRSAKICNAVGQGYVDLKREAARAFFEKALRENQENLRQVQQDIRKVQDELVKVNIARYQAQQNGDIAEEARLLNRSYDLTTQQDTYIFTQREYQQKRQAYSNQLRDGIEGGPFLSRPAAFGAPVGADRKKDLMLGLLVGLMFGIGISIFREYLDDTMRDKEAAQRELGVPVLANLPETEGIEGFDAPSGATVEAARTLRATLASMGVPNEKSVLLITSSLAKSRAATLVSLAGAFAESGRSVLVIGSDLRSGRTHESFGIANTVGLANVVRGQVSLEKAVRPAPGLDGVYVLPSGPVIGNPGEVLSSEEMAFMLRRARRWADVVLLDAPPVLAAADSSILGAYADGVVLVVAAGRTNRRQAVEAKEQLIAAGARVLGAVLVGSEETAHQDGGYGDDLGSGSMPMWGGNDYGADYSDWYSDEIVTASASLSPRPRSPRREPAKKVSAASVKARPSARPAEPRAPRNARTTTGRTAAGRTAAQRTSGARATAKKTATKTTASKSASKTGSAKKPAASTARKRTSPARVQSKPRTTKQASLPRTKLPRPTPLSRRSYDW